MAKQNLVISNFAAPCNWWGFVNTCFSCFLIEAVAMYEFINAVFLKIIPLAPGIYKKVIHKHTCSWKLQVCSSMSGLFGDTGCSAVAAEDMHCMIRDIYTKVQMTAVILSLTLITKLRFPYDTDLCPFYNSCRLFFTFSQVFRKCLLFALLL